MFGIFNRCPEQARRKSGRFRAPTGTRIYAIGDVHGCKRQLELLLDAIAKDQEGRESRIHLIFLGDLVDRGPDSAGVVDYLCTKQLPAEEVTFLMGNHEEVMLECYDGNTERAATWFRFGGLETLESYGVTREEVFSRGFDLSETMRRLIPHRHVSFIRAFQDSLILGDYLFVHAGIRPGVPIEEQDAKDIRWIGNEFLRDHRAHEYKVVHGHSISATVSNRRNRIGVDTGAYRTGNLSAIVLEGERVSTIGVRRKNRQ